MGIYKRGFDGTGCMYFSIKDKIFLRKINEIYEKVNNIIRKEFNSEPLHNKKYLKVKKSTQKKALNVFKYKYY